jgi:tRNA(Ile)-lysidine synthase
MSLLQRFTAYIQSNNLFQPKDRLLLAVSGGVDSVALCEFCKQAGYSFLIAHCNFQLRGAESDRDENFVRSLGEKYGVHVLVKKFDTRQIAQSEKKSIETTARDLRYQWFHQILQAAAGKSENEWHLPADMLTLSPLKWLLTAHHADDSIETSVMNFFRGTGIAGVRGILPKQGNIIRPLLFARRKELEDFVSACQLSFVTDSTNLENEYTRNLFRNTILPLVTEVYPEALKNVLNNTRRFSETEILYLQAIAQHKKKLLQKKGNEFHIPVLLLQKTVPLQTVLYEIIKEFGFTAHQTEDAMGLLGSETGKYIQSATHRLIKNRQWLIITAVQSSGAQHILLEQGDRNIHFHAGTLTMELHANGTALSAAPSIAQLDAALIQYPLLLRPWKPGDYFYPLGMQKKKKLSRFFTDQKLSLTQKENAWVIEMDKKIVWVVGKRIDDRFKITPATKQVLLLQLH